MRFAVASIILVALLAGCGTNRMAGADGTMGKISSAQIRQFPGAPDTHALRAVMDTMQQFGFAIDMADASSGVIVGSRAEGALLRMSVSVDSTEDGNMLVRAVARYGNNMLSTDRTYRGFFDALAARLQQTG